MKLKAAIVDDELHCIETLKFDLESLLSEQVEVVFTCSNGVECIQQLKKNPPDLLFMDIEMPGITGFEVLKILDNQNCMVVFTTAHAKHAIKAIDFKPEAYLLKPIMEDELISVVNSLHSKFNPVKEHRLTDKLAISTTEEIELIPHQDIIYAKANNNYTDLYIKDQKNKLVSKTLKVIEEKLPEDSFFRTHKSYLVNLNHIAKYRKAEGGVLIMSNGDELPVSSIKKEELLSLIQTVD